MHSRIRSLLQSWCFSTSLHRVIAQSYFIERHVYDEDRDLQQSAEPGGGGEGDDGSIYGHHGDTVSSPTFGRTVSSLPPPPSHLKTVKKMNGEDR